MRVPLLLCVAFLVTSCEPQDVRPGMWVHGELVEDRVADWSFTDDVEEIFIETRPWYFLPHSTTIWCVERDGALYIGSYGEEKKTWEQNVARNPAAKLAISGRRYDVTVAPVTDPALVDELDLLYAEKYDMAEVFGEEVPEWWYYAVVQDGP